MLRVRILIPSAGLQEVQRPLQRVSPVEVLRVYTVHGLIRMSPGNPPH